MTTMLKARVRTEQLHTLLREHKRKHDLIEAGKGRDSLLRALIPLYVARGRMRVTSGATSRVWARYGVKVLPSVIARALLWHIGYARHTRMGPQITPNGIKYVEAALR